MVWSGERKGGDTCRFRDGVGLKECRHKGHRNNDL